MRHKLRKPFGVCSFAPLTPSTSPNYSRAMLAVCSMSNSVQSWHFPPTTDFLPKTVSIPRTSHTRITLENCSPDALRVKLFRLPCRRFALRPRILNAARPSAVRLPRPSQAPLPRSPPPLLPVQYSRRFLHIRTLRPRSFPSVQSSTSSLAQTCNQNEPNRSPGLRHSPCFGRVSYARRKPLHSLTRSTETVHRRLKRSTCLESRVHHPLLFDKRLGF